MQDKHNTHTLSENIKFTLHSLQNRMEKLSNGLFFYLFPKHFYFFRQCTDIFPSVRNNKLFYFNVYFIVAVSKIFVEIAAIMAAISTKIYSNDIFM